MVRKTMDDDDLMKIIETRQAKGGDRCEVTKLREREGLTAATLVLRSSWLNGERLTLAQGGKQ